MAVFCTPRRERRRARPRCEPPARHVIPGPRARERRPDADPRPDRRTGPRATSLDRSPSAPCPWRRERRHARFATHARTRSERRRDGGSPFASSGLSPDTDDTQHRTRSIARIGPMTGPASPRESPHTPDAARGHPYAPGMPTVYGETLFILSGLSGSEANLVSVAMFAMDRQWIRFVTVTGSRLDRRSAIVPGRMVGSVER